MDGAGFSVLSVFLVLKVLPLSERDFQHRGHGDDREMRRERNWESSRYADLDGGDFRQVHDRKQRHPERREKMVGQYRRGEIRKSL